MPRTVAVLAAVAIFQVIGTVVGGAVAPAAAASPAQSSGEPSADLAACFHGTCTVTVSGPVEIPLDGRAGFTALSVRHLDSSMVTLSASGDNMGAASSTVSSGSTSSFGSATGTLTVHVSEITGGTARLEITTSAA